MSCARCAGCTYLPQVVVHPLLLSAEVLSLWRRRRVVRGVVQGGGGAVRRGDCPLKCGAYGPKVQPPRCGINQVVAQVVYVAMGVPSQCSPHLERPPVRCRRSSRDWDVAKLPKLKRLGDDAHFYVSFIKKHGLLFEEFLMCQASRHCRLKSTL